jgi:hypothetical protein
MTIIEKTHTDGALTTMLSGIDPVAADMRRRINEYLDEEAIEKRRQLVSDGNIWDLISSIHPQHILDNRDLLIQAAISRELAMEKEGPTMRYSTFIYCVRTAQNPDDILYAMPVEWVGKIP